MVPKRRRWMAQTRLKQLREEAVLTVHELAEASGVSDDTISKIENGQRVARPSTLRKLASALDVSPQELRRPAKTEEPAIPLAEAPRTGPSDADWSLVHTEHVEFLDSLGDSLEGLNQRTQERLDRSGNDGEALVALFQDTFIAIMGAMSLVGDIEEYRTQIGAESKEERRARIRVERAAAQLEDIFESMIAGLELTEGSGVTHMEEYLQRRRAG
jgi:transcriptional regulator with XRE-family HTH domain